MPESRYEHDPRVRRIEDWLYAVTASDRYQVEELWSGPGWVSRPTLDSDERRRAGRVTREDAERWVAENTSGPFLSADEAIAALIGEPW